MESDEGVSLPLIHEHLMVPWNHVGKGDCCGGFEVITDGYYCKKCKFFVHKKCSESSEYIQHPSHPGHTLQLQRKANVSCDLCGKDIWSLSYHCEACDFNMDLYCVKYPPPKVIDVSEKHRHKLTLLKKRIMFYCDTTTCRKYGYEFPYKCDDCDSAFHVDCVWHPSEVKHPLEYTTMDAGERVLLPWIHKHFMMPWNSQKKGSCCKRYEIISDGYYCKRCNLFFHKKCGDKVPQSIQHPSHSIHPLWLQLNRNYSYLSCNSCGRRVKDLFYRCHICDLIVDLCCATYPPPEVIDISKKHHHKLTLLKKRIDFKCDAKCGKISYEFPYKCNECDLAFHVDCVWQPNISSKVEVNHSYHPWHPLTLLTGQPPEYSDGKCRLCGKKIDRLFYHCSSCNFTLDMCCVYKPPPQYLLDLKAHDHQLTLLPRLDSFTCNACGLKGDRSPYGCFPCGFMIHQECLPLPRVININRHDHRVSRTSILGVVNSVCGVCRKKVDWAYGGYLCQSCPPGYVVHSKCATRELEDVPEEIEDIEPYVVIDEHTIQHFSHKAHFLRLHGNGVLYEESKWCRIAL
ncbi:hypothetical protein AALP_AA6G018200 [Arabis alpina]|uniref:Phorbol-ester/DAG-type domain-containing protein n=1 Tax=Arabis alpina TaxID=50452 RepID=A0A087GLG4_ARAAL|nr:hypothetical protein AALP_AA6G018200 [Arabis alpina]